MMDWQRAVNDPLNVGKHVFPVTWEGQTCWIKRAEKHTMNAFQRWQTRGRAPFGGEAQALLALKKRGAQVPDILYHDQEFMVLSDVGMDIQRWLHRMESDFMRQKLVARVASDLYALHRRDGWHGNAAMRNFSWHRNTVYMMDLADTAHPRWSLPMKQAYDVWQGLYSLGRQRNGMLLTRQWLRSYPVQYRRLKAVAWLLSPLVAILRPFRGLMKRDISQGLIALEALLWF